MTSHTWTNHPVTAKWCPSTTRNPRLTTLGLLPTPVSSAMLSSASGQLSGTTLPFALNWTLWELVTLRPLEMVLQSTLYTHCLMVFHLQSTLERMSQLRLAAASIVASLMTTVLLVQTPSLELDLEWNVVPFSCPTLLSLQAVWSPPVRYGVETKLPMCESYPSKSLMTITWHHTLMELQRVLRTPSHSTLATSSRIAYQLVRTVSTTTPRRTTSLTWSTEFVI